MKRITRMLGLVLGSRRFAAGVLAFFGLESVWVALSSVYPMAFDEDFHFGLVKFYSHYWLPFLSSQPHEASQFGALYRDPSYLYHYLMSFPLRLVDLFTHNQTAEVICLRLLSATFFGIGLMLFYVFLRRSGLSRMATNTALALFVLIPIVPLLAGQINYDNLLFPLVALTCLLVQRVYRRLQTGAVDVAGIVYLAAVCMLASLVKYAFLPVALAAGIFLVVSAWTSFRKHPERRHFWAAATRGYQSLGLKARVVLVALLIVSGGLFVQRYGANVVAYHTPLPDCGAVLTTDECLAYSPWARDYGLSQTKGDVDADFPGYAWTWLQAMHYRMFFMITGATNNFLNYPPMPLPSAAFIVLGVTGAVALALYWRRVFAERGILGFLLLASILYVVTLFVMNYSQFLETGQPVAINGRYLLMILLPLAAVLGRALGLALRSLPAARLWVAALALLCFLQGGGLMSFILRSDASWYWPNPVVLHTNNAVREVLAPFVIEGSKYY